MAKVIVTYYKMQELEIGKRMYYYEAFIDELRQLGNDVLVVNTAFFNSYHSNVVTNKQLNSMILKKATEFNPDLIITFNHRIPQCILDNFDVPIIIWDGDSPLYLCDVNYIKKNVDRYKVFSISKDWYQDYRDMGFGAEAYAFMPNATSVRKKNLEQNMNITYLGTRIWTNQSIPKGMYKHVYLPKAKEIVLENLTTGNGCSQDYLEKYFEQQKEISGWDERMIYPLLEKRWLTLANVLDMGLTLCGSYSRWESVYEMMPQLLAMYDPRRVWTLEENIDFYNSSKISLSPIHPQANGKAFPWRAFDVMASNACLVIEKSSDLKELLHGEVDIPMFDSPYDVRKICKDLLEDEKRRKEIVELSQRWVEKNARWIDRFKDTEQIIGIKLFNGNEPGKLEEIINEAGIITNPSNGKGHKVHINKNNVVTLDNKEKETSAKETVVQKIKKKMGFRNMLNMTKWMAIFGAILSVLRLLDIADICKTVSQKQFDVLVLIILVVNITFVVVVGLKVLFKVIELIKRKLINKA